MRRAIQRSPFGPCHTAYMLAITASSTCAVHTLLVAFSRRMCCSRVCSAIRSAGFPSAPRGTPLLAAGQQALEFISRREKGGVRTAKAHRHAEALRAADADVGTPFPWRGEKHEAHQIRRGDDDGVRGVCLLGEVPIIVNRAVGRWILHQRAEDVVSELITPKVTDDDLN